MKRSLLLSELRRGLQATLPLLPGVLAAALAYGVLARQVGLAWGEAWAMSVAVFAGAAQFAVLQAWATATPLALLILTFVVNARYLPMGASMSTRLGSVPLGRKALAFFGLSDESYALTIGHPGDERSCFSYFVGANLGLYSCWVLGSLMGALMSEALPFVGDIKLHIVFPLVFLGMAVPLVTDRTTLIVALAAAGLTLSPMFQVPVLGYPVVAGLLAAGIGVALEHLGRKPSWKRS